MSPNDTTRFACLTPFALLGYAVRFVVAVGVTVTVGVTDLIYRIRSII
jgi:hypothetical protein